MDQEEFARRRRRLMEHVGKGSIAILPTAVERIRNRDVHYPFRPDSDFYYLSGFPEPEAVIVLVPGRAQGEFLIFCRERDAERETWDGRRAGLEGACAQYGADDAFPITDLDDILPGLLENRERIYYTMGLDPEFDQRVLGWLNRVRGKARQGVNAPEEFITLAHVLHELRLHKSRAEVRVMRRAAEIAAEGHREAMVRCRPGMHEYQIEAILQHAFLQAGSRSPAYPSIVGGGVNGCILHYRENASVLCDGDLLLIDAGAEYDCYASDITRTFPVNGSFSPLQRDIYEVVLEAQLAAIAKCRAGNHWDDPHQAAVRVLTRGLVGLGLLKGRVPTLIREGAYRSYYMHRTGHWLGMDVHDVGDYKVGGQWRLLEAGMTLTVEPGLYFIPGTKGLPKRFAGIGIRIEDDVLVTRGEPDVLSRAAPKTVAEIESLMAQGQAAAA
ncbi:MAG TPA: Xaa-Pro aminopeptidase [Gammaproteobacteria bacterium]|nr:Xaa-Pro aminopeptidase [Gammaproteobacteria bacterium]